MEARLSDRPLVGAGEGHGVTVFGRKRVAYTTAGGHKIALDYIVANVRFPIGSVSKMCAGKGEAHHTPLAERF